MTTYSPSSPGEPYQKINRNQLVSLAEAALRVKNFRFARQITMNWLGVYNADLRVNVLLARAMAGENKLAQAYQVLDRVCKRDPEFLEGQAALADVQRRMGDSQKRITAINLHILDGRENYEDVLPGWSHNLQEAYRLAGEEKYDEAVKILHQVLGVEGDPVLAAILHLKITRKREDLATTIKLADLYINRWPECLQFKLLYADALMEIGDEVKAVNLLHECASKDVTGQTAQRLWGADHPYRPLWPRNLEAAFNLPVPADVAGVLGLNWLPAGGGEPKAIPEVFAGMAFDLEPAEIDPEELPSFESLVQEARSAEEEAVRSASQPEEPPFEMLVGGGEKSADEAGSSFPAVEMSAGRSQTEDTDFPKSPPWVDPELDAVEQEFEKLAEKMKQPSLAREDSRFPTYVLLTSRKGLTAQYGVQTAEIVIKEMAAIASAVQAAMPKWSAAVFVPDDADQMKLIGLEAIESSDPWKIKLALADFDQTLAKRGEMIGAVLIVGGPEIIPFHRLPNPTDDSDPDVLSDNPYATLDSNYFVPEWPVGRLPGESGPDASALLGQLRNVARRYQRGAKINLRKLNPSSWRQLLLAAYDALIGIQSPNFGYTAAVWKRSSIAAFKPIGDARQLRVSPPEMTGRVDGKKILAAGLNYYNLHGLIDSSDWYGQKESGTRGDGPEYPVALSPSDLRKNGRCPQFVFSEACYGAHITGKGENSSLALKFLSLGASCVVGSTCVSYGSVNTPLIGADLLGYAFWKYLRAGFPAGQAFMQAKIDLANEMHSRQGYLDGEDQKTLISFVLYGDPLASREKSLKKAKGITRQRVHRAVKTVCDRAEDEHFVPEINGEMLRKVKKEVEVYLPGLENASVLINRQHGTCNARNHRCPTHEIGAKNAAGSLEDRLVVTFSKRIEVASRTNFQYARATLDKEGKMIKLAVSR